MRKRRLKRRLMDAVRSESRATQEACRVAHEADRLRLALEAVPQALVVWDETGEVILRSRPVTEDMARSGGLLVDAAVDELVHDGASALPVTRTLDLHGPPPRQLVLRALPLCQDGASLGTLAVVDDVSERRHLEAVRRDFVANVSHELRTPVGALALLGEALTGETDPIVVSRLAARITAEADRAARMIEDLLDLSRIEAGGPSAGADVSVGSVVSAAVDRAQSSAVLRDVRLVVSASTDSDVEVEGDEAQLVSAVANLVDNAVKYSDHGSTVEVTVGVVDRMAEVTVRDHGIGIPRGDLERIFERFYRVDRARSRDTGGSGLGLSIVRHIATNHRGDVSVQSTEGEGSTFTLRIPLPGMTPTL